MRNKLIEHYKHNYASSPFELTDSELDYIIENDCECSSCGNDIFEEYDAPNIIDNKLLCESCYHEQYYDTCPICKDYFWKPQTPQEDILIISEHVVKEYGLRLAPGFYQVLEYPYYYGNILTGFDDLFYHAIKLLRRCNINAIMFALYPVHGNEQVGAGSCCDSCYNKYTGRTRLLNRYCNKVYGKKRIAFERKVILSNLK